MLHLSGTNDEANRYWTQMLQFLNFTMKADVKRGIFDNKFNGSFGFNAESCIMLIVSLSPLTSKWLGWC